MLMSLKTFTDAYLRALMWSETDDEGRCFEDKAEITDEALATIEADCRAFYTAYVDTWRGAHRRASEYTDDELAGFDLALTRNGHGAGFWDGDWEEPAASTLTEAAKRWGPQGLYRGDDGKVYVSD